MKIEHLMPHQREGAQRLREIAALHRGRALLGDRPGLGKTITGYATMGEGEPLLIVGPASARASWQREAQALEWSTPYEMRSYDEIVRGGNELLYRMMQRGVTRLIIDESHYLKHEEALRTQIMLGRHGYARHMREVLALSGTMMPRHPDELWALLSSLFPAEVLALGFKTASEWREHFTVRRGRMVRGRWIEKVIGGQNLHELRPFLDTLKVARTPDDIGLSLPPLWVQTKLVDIGASASDFELLMEPDAFTEVHTALNGGVGELEEIAQDVHIARMRRRLGEWKVPIALDLLSKRLEEINEKIVVFAHHTSVLDALQVGLGGYGLVRIDGSTSAKDRKLREEQFQTRDDVRVFLGQNHAAKESLTLTAASYALNVEPDWAGYVNDQLGHRIKRIGSTADHCVYQMLAIANTLDEAIVRQIERETKLVQEVERR